MTHPRRLRRLSAAAAALVLVGVGLTGSASGQASGRGIVIGVGGPLAGGAATFGVEMRQAVELAVEEKNAGGGILGTPVAVEVLDDGADARSGEAVARRFCDNPSVLGVVGHVNSGVSIAASTVYDGCGLPMVTPMSSNPAVTDRGLPNVFRLTNRDDHKGPALAAYLYRRGKRKAVVVDDQTAYGRGLADLFARTFQTEGGQVLARPAVRVGERDFRALVGSLPSDFDLLFFGGIAEAAPLLKQMREAGLNQLFACGDGCWDVKGFIQPSAGAATRGEGVVVLSAAPAVGWVPGSREFAERYTKRYGPIANYAPNSYDAARLLLAAIEQAPRAAGGPPSRADVLAAVRSQRFQGIAYARPVEWDARGDNKGAVIFLNVVEGDHFKEIAELTPPGAPR
jgi:branched-chain amino acid transport system substrate-binding protein